jgi:hypothetical protein
MRDILVIGLIIVVVIVLIRVVYGTPLVRRVMESFTVTMMNTTTECHSGSQMYMYDGAAFCCSGRINPDANSLADSCPKSGTSAVAVNFCALGPSQKGVPNCLETANALYDKEGLRFCPPTMPNYVKTTSGQGRCCASAVNPRRTECTVPSAGTCDVAATTNVFQTLSKTNPSCQFQKAQADDGACPPTYSPMVFHIDHGIYAGRSLYGCINPMKGGCLAPATLDRMKRMNYDVTGIPVCK